MRLKKFVNYCLLSLFSIIGYLGLSLLIIRDAYRDENWVIITVIFIPFFLLIFKLFAWLLEILLLKLSKHHIWLAEFLKKFADEPEDEKNENCPSIDQTEKADGIDYSDNDKKGGRDSGHDK